MANKIILNLAISLDGYIADSDGGYDWIQPSGNPELNTAPIWSHDKFLEHVSDVVMGKTCYDQQFHKDHQNRQVHVVTSKDLKDYENIHFIGKDICREVAALKQKAIGDIYLFGGGLSIDPLLKAGMIEEYIIAIIPIILGKGIPLFLDNNPRIPLYLTHSYTENGVVILRYIPRSLAEQIKEKDDE